MTIPTAFLDEIRSRIPVSDVVGRRVKLKKTNREFSGLCPFHHEKTPSFTVNDDKGFFHCFGCGAHGDVIAFTMQSDALEFLEAVERMAEQAGLTMPGKSPEDAALARRMGRLYDAMAAAAAWFRHKLEAPGGQDARAYLAGRGVTAAEIARFGIGFAPPARGQTLGNALSHDFDEATLIEAGLIRVRGEERIDYFRERIMFPIIDRRGRVIAFGARVMGTGSPKYLNSPETPIFHKGSVLYGMQALVGDSIVDREKPNGCVMVEGYLDVIAMQHNGFGNTLAPLGTALTADQLTQLWRLSHEPILCFDGDKAGQMAAARAVERAIPMMEGGRSLRFAALPAGQDPDSIIRRVNVAAMREVLASSITLAEMIWNLETAEPATTPEAKAALDKRLEDRIQPMDRVFQSHYRDYFAERMGKRRRRGAATAAATRPAGSAQLRRRQDETFLAVLINHPFLLDERCEEISAVDLKTQELDELRRVLMEAHLRVPDMDALALQNWLRDNGQARTLDSVLSPDLLARAPFTRPEAAQTVVRAAWEEIQAAMQSARLRERLGALRP